MDLVVVLAVAVIVLGAAVWAVSSYRRHAARAERASRAALLLLQAQADAIGRTAESTDPDARPLLLDAGELPQEPDRGA